MVPDKSNAPDRLLSISRPLLNNAGRIFLLLDSASMEALLEEGNRDAAALLSYSSVDQIGYARTPRSLQHDLLNRIPEYSLTEREEDETNINSNGIISIDFGQDIKIKNFWFFEKDRVELVAKEFFSKRNLRAEEISIVRDLLVWKTVYDFFRSGSPLSSHSAETTVVLIFVSNDENILKRRSYFESSSPRKELVIWSVEDTAQLINLFLKMNEVFLLPLKTVNYFLSKYSWYRVSMRHKIQRILSVPPYTQALAVRMMYGLIAVDEMGIQFFRGPTIDNHFTMLYHFNNLLMLISGIFDNLAQTADKYLDINFPDPIRMSLFNSRSQEFLREIKCRHPDLRKLIESHGYFISLIYDLREIVAHREGFRGAHLSREAYTIYISKDLFNRIKQIEGQRPSREKLQRWGIVEWPGGDSVPERIFLEPYQFSLKAMSILIDFINEFMDLLGASPWANDISFKDLKEKVGLFEKYHLGF